MEADRNSCYCPHLGDPIARKKYLNFLHLKVKELDEAHIELEQMKRKANCTEERLSSLLVAMEGYLSWIEKQLSEVAQDQAKSKLSL